MRNAVASAIQAIMLLAATTLSATSAPTEGTWTATEKSGAQLQLTFQWNSSTWGRSIARSELQGLSERQITSTTSTPVSFRIEREAGVFELDGVFKEGKGAGHFLFHPNRQFAATLRSLGVEDGDRVTDRQLMKLAWAGLSSAMVREFTTLGLGPLSVDNLVELAIHNVTPDYVRSIRALDISGTNTVSGVVQMRIHRITPEFVRALAELGYRELSRGQLLQMGIHSVTPEFIRQLRAAGYADLSPRQLVKMRIHQVTPEYIRNIREVGIRDLSPDALVELRIHRITPEYVRQLEALGYRGLSRRQLLQMGIHGVTPAFIRQMREAGFRDLPPETLVKMKIHGIDSELVRGAGRSSR